MQNLNQTTIQKPISFEGVGLHSGLVSKVRVLPAEDNQGILFKRIDLKDNNLIEANFKNVSSAKLCTNLTNSYGASVSTVEHLLAAFYINGVDNAIVEINNLEVPIMDGSSRDFIDLINNSGIKKQKSKRKFLKILKKVELEENGKFISIEPNINGFEVDFQLVYTNKIIGNQRNCINFNSEDLSDIYLSRTFCLYEDIEKLREMGLAKGGSLENAIVVKDNLIVNKEGLRNEKEFVNHKILDCMGDLYLAGYKIIGKITCSRGGHKLTNQLLRKAFQDKNNFSLIEIKEKNLPHAFINKGNLKAIA